MRQSAVIALLLLQACGLRQPRTYRVIPASPEYLLQSPNAGVNSFPEILRQYNGFVRGRNGMDMHPGMELRIENAYYQAGMPKRGLTGYLGTEIARYLVQASGLNLLSSQPMTGRPADQPPVQDLIPPSKRGFGYYRFYFEVVFKAESANRGSVLLGAESPGQLSTLADLLSQDPDSVCGGDGGHCIVFPEACSVSVEMAITVNGLRQDVVWGSELSSVVPSAKQIRLRRLYQGKPVAVRIDSLDRNTLSLPLLPGDLVDWK